MSPVDPTSKRVVIIGGGIAGLGAAHALEERIPGVRIRLVEAAPILGGTIRTESNGGFVLERGADSWVTTKPHATALARKVGVETKMMGPSKENHGVYVAWDERLHRVPDGVILGVPMRPTELATSSLFSAAGKARMAMEPFLGGRRGATKTTSRSAAFSSGASAVSSPSVSALRSSVASSPARRRTSRFAPRFRS